jgi:hypothetical protein
MPDKPFGTFRWLGLTFFFLAICALILGFMGKGSIAVPGVIINHNAWAWVCLASTFMGVVCFFAGDTHDKNHKKLGL